MITISERAPAPERAAGHLLAIHDLIARFFAVFDDKNWAAMRACLCHEVFTDYSSFCEVRPATISAGEYIEQCRMVLDWLDTQHTFHNLQVTIDEIEGTASARCNFVFRRFHRLDANHYFHSYGHYHFDLVNLHGEWKIARLKQDLLRNEGSREIHPSVWCT
jgi:hypothetical protein